MNIWGFEIPDNLLDTTSRSWLSQWEVQECPPVEEIWRLMDEVWDDMSLDNQSQLSTNALSCYYSHPVWLLNGIFTEVDPISASHRNAIANHIASANLHRGADYGGGFGALALRIADVCPDCTIDIVEPFPSKVAQKRINSHRNITFVSQLNKQYDFVIAQDVLEHVEDPIALAQQLVNAIRPGGVIYFANCFFPVIKCHLPHTFHLRCTFRWVVAPLGLEYAGTIPDTQHILRFRRRSCVSNLSKTRSRERVSRVIGSLINSIGDAKSKIINFIKR